MDRRNFLNNACTAGFCGCVFTSLFATDIAEGAEEKEKKKEQPVPKWHGTFVKKRYNMLMAILYAKLGKEEFSETIQQLGTECSKSWKELNNYKGKPDEYFEMMRNQWREESIWDKDNGVITVTTEPKTECFCPLIDTKSTRSYVCDCSLGWQKQTMKTVFGKDVEVELLKSLLRGDNRCSMRIRIKQ